MYPNRLPTPPAASVADLAYAQAIAGQGRAASLNSFTHGATALTLDTPLAAPSAVILGAGLVTPKASGRFMCSFILSFTIGAAANVITTLAIEPATGLTGGTLFPASAFRYRAGGAIAITGAGAATGAWSQEQAIATGDIAFYTIPISLMLPATPAAQSVIAFAVTTTGTISNALLGASYFELP